MVNFLVFGPPGSGKGTQSVQLAERFNLVHLSTGDMLRDEIGASTDLGERVKSIMAAGELVPDEIVIEMIASRIDSRGDAAGFIFDGFPRTCDQAMALDRMLAERSASINIMLVLEVEHEELVRRLLSRAEVSGRADDANREVIERRIDVYMEKTEPVARYYRKLNKYRAIDGMGEIADIFERLSVAVKEYM
jgi:adenylate kinase